MQRSKSIGTRCGARVISVWDKYVQLDERNIPIIAGTTMKVVELIISGKAYGWSLEELHTNYPRLMS